MSTILDPCYYAGDGVEKDLGRALALFQKAGKAGNVDAGPLGLSWPDIFLDIGDEKNLATVPSDVAASARSRQAAGSAALLCADKTVTAASAQAVAHARASTSPSGRASGFFMPSRVFARDSGCVEAMRGS